MPLDLPLYYGKKRFPRRVERVLSVLTAKFTVWHPKIAGRFSNVVCHKSLKKEVITVFDESCSQPRWVHFTKFVLVSVALVCK